MPGELLIIVAATLRLQDERRTRSSRKEGRVERGRVAPKNDTSSPPCTHVCMCVCARVCV